MDNLAKCLRYYIADRLNSDPGWKNLTVSLLLSPLREMEEVFGLGWDPAEEQQKFDRSVSRPGSELLLTVGRPACPAGASEIHFVLIAPSPSPICCDFTEERGGGLLLKATISRNGRQGFRNTFSALGESVKIHCSCVFGTVSLF